MSTESAVRERSTSAQESWKLEQQLSGYKDLLVLMARGSPRDEVLNALVRFAQGITANPSRAAIFVMDASEAKLRFAAAAGLSEEYTAAIDGFPVGPTMPSCGNAAYTGQAVIVHDVGADPLWAPYVELAKTHGIAACWSFPMRRGKEILGTFALYHQRKCSPDEREYAEVEYLASIASLVLQRDDAGSRPAVSLRAAP